MANDLVFELRDGDIVEITRRTDNVPVAKLTCDQAWAFYHWWNDGICPVCANDINVGETICDDCFADAQNYRETH